MKARRYLVSGMFALVALAGCASTKIEDRKILVNEQLPRPNQIWVYDFVGTPADLPADSGIENKLADHPTPQTAEQIAAGRYAGAQIAAELVAGIRELGMPAKRAKPDSQPQINDLIIRGYLLGVNEGSAVKRVALGFGAGSSELSAAAEGFQVTANGLRKLGSGTVDSGGSKTPGAALGVVGLIATANPAGLILSTGVKVYGEVSGNSKIEGRAKAAAEEIVAAIKPRMQAQGWIQ